MTQSRSRARVLIGFADALAAPEVVWSLADDGWRVSAFTRRGAKTALRRLEGVELLEVTAPESDAPRCAEELRDIVERGDFASAMPLDDMSVWLFETARLGDLVAIAGPAGENVTLALDKRIQLERAEQAGFRVPATTAVESVADALGHDSFPCMVKPTLAAQLVGDRLTRGGTHICADNDELARALSSLDGPVLVQELLGGVGEGISGVADGGIAQRFTGHRRIRMMNPEGSGSSACVWVAPRPEEQAAAERLLEAAAWSGLFMVELLRDESGDAWFIEFNGRAWGSLALARRTGLEFPAAAARIAAGEPADLPAPAVTVPIVCRHLGRELVHLLLVLRGRRSSAAPRSSSRVRQIAQLLRTRRSDRWYNWRRGCLLFFLEDTWRTVAAVLPSRSARS